MRVKAVERPDLEGRTAGDMDDAFRFLPPVVRSDLNFLVEPPRFGVGLIWVIPGIERLDVRGAGLKAAALDTDGLQLACQDVEVLVQREFYRGSIVISNGDDPCPGWIEAFRLRRCSWC